MNAILPKLIGLVALAAIPNAQAWSTRALLEPAEGYGADDNYFGRSLSFHGDWALIGAPGLESSRGSAYIFEGQGALWVQRTKLTSPSSDLHEDFGRSSALGDGFGLIGAPEWNDDRGRVYTISGSGENWSFGQELVSPESGEKPEFGRSIVLDDDLAVIGAPGIDRAFVYELRNSQWTHIETIEPPRKAREFGFSLSIDSDRLLIGAPKDNQAFLYRRTQSGFVTEAAFRSLISDFGAAVSLRKSELLIGAPDDDIGGRAFLYEEDLGQWRRTANFAPTLSGPIEFGAAVSLGENILVIGAPHENVLGTAHIYLRNNAGWYEAAILDPPLPPLQGNFGGYVQIYRDAVYANIGLDETPNFGVYAGAITIWTANNANKDGLGPRNFDQY